ncbi:phage tail protein [Francisella philomiragia]|uniref:Tail fiber protein n=1 Tax=Francisella philomiragia TaxID=28110 RepID=A0ABS1GC83_9GAMM|nr:phage tail protein [Francisella philomiragia]MBK2258744.1 tail fiber protein [Francisella philomiragia]MBK2302435.1 tail fiber protein [Francisella philomiragia]
MSIIPFNEFTGKILPPSTEYPYGKAKNVSSQGAGDGTPLVANLLNDIFGFQQFLLDKAGIVPNGTPDTAVNSQYFQALWKIVNMMSITINLTADADYTLTATENLHKNITITDTGNVLTATRNIVVDNIGKQLVVTNSTNYDLEVKTNSGNGVVISVGSTKTLINNSSEIIDLPNPNNLPTGSLISIPADIAPPKGFLAAEGGNVSRTVFSNLFAVYGTTFGVGDGLTTFGLIDMRGNFTRGLGGNSDAIGVLQADELKSHRHTSWIYQGNVLNLQYAGYPNTYSMVGGNTGYTGGIETRPVNYAVKYFIKY